MPETGTSADDTRRLEDALQHEFQSVAQGVDVSRFADGLPATDHRQPSRQGNIAIPVAAAAAVAAIGAAGWAITSHVDDNTPPATPAAPADSGPVLTTPPVEGRQFVEGALVRGTLTLRGGCLFINDAAVIWPAGTTWDGEAQAVVFANDQGVAKLGERFAGGGGYHSPGESLRDVVGDDAYEAVLDCPLEEVAEPVVLAHPITVD